jgi:hypothetical protein
LKRSRAIQVSIHDVVKEAKRGLHVPEMDRQHQVVISLMDKLHVLHEKSAECAHLVGGNDVLAAPGCEA